MPCALPADSRVIVLALLLLAHALLSALPHATAAARARALPPCARAGAPDFSALGPWAAYVDASRAPLLWPGVLTRDASSAHELEADFGSWLYAEGESDLFFLDAAGPVCLTRLHLVFNPPAPTVRANQATLHLEVDGVRVLSETAAALFAPPGVPALPPELTLAKTDNHPAHLMQAPVCARARLRAALSYPDNIFQRPGGAPLVLGAPALVDDGAACAAAGSFCVLRQTVNANLARLRAWPRGWRPFDGSAAALASAAPLARAGLALAADPPTLSPLRLLRAAAARADAALSASNCGDLSAAAPEFVMFHDAAGRAGAVLSMQWAFSPLGGGGDDEVHAWLHACGVELVALWDRGEGEGGGGALILPLDALFGPPAVGPARVARHDFLYFGEHAHGLPVAGPAAARWGVGAPPPAAARVAYVALPAPYWRTARVALRLRRGDGALPAPSVRVCAVVHASRDAGAVGRGGGGPGDEDGAACGGAPYSPRDAGYLQGALHDIPAAARGVRDANVLLNVSRVRGKLVALTQTVSMRGDNAPDFVEGDVRLFVDGSATPAEWSTGWEDFFGGAHAFKHIPTRTDPLHGHDFGETARKGRLPVYDVFAARLLASDALAFHASLTILLEGFARGAQWQASLRGAALFYAAPVPPPARTDALDPGDAEGGGAYRVAAGSVAARYALASAVGGNDVPPLAANATASAHIKAYVAAGVAFEGEIVAIPRVLALAQGAAVELSLRVDARADVVLLRRLVDVRHSVQRARVRANGVDAGVWLSSARDFGWLNTSWRWEDLALPAAATRGRDVVALRIVVEADPGNARRALSAGATGEPVDRGAVGGVVLLRA